MSSSALGDLRLEVESIDGQLVDLIAQRFEVARKIEAAKRENGGRIICQRREAEELNNLCGQAISREIDPDFVRSIFRLIIDESIRVQLAQREAADDR